MPNPIIRLGVVAAALVLAGLVKGFTGLALPTVGIGLLSLTMPPAHAAALIVAPAFITNVWQMISGSGLGKLIRRLWLMQLGVCLGTWAGAGLMTGSQAGLASVALGVALLVYAAIGLMNVRVPQVRASAEWWLGPFVGGATGLMTAATGVFVIPARARSEYKPVPRSSEPEPARDQASATVETLKERPSAFIRSSRSLPKG